MRAELVVVQREYVEVCGEREKLTQQLEEVREGEGIFQLFSSSISTGSISHVFRTISLCTV